MLSYNEAESIKKACKSAKYEIVGDNAYGYLKFESGVHKVQRVPITETKGRVHSSTCQVVIMKDSNDKFVEQDLDEQDLKYEYMRAGGAGGQHVNKTESAVRVTHIPTGVSVHISESREQHSNKLKALNILKTKLAQTKRQEFTDKLNIERKNQLGTGNLSEKIRTYNFPDSRVTDHRLGLTIYNIDKMMEGDMLGDLIEKLREKEHSDNAIEILNSLSAKVDKI